MKTISLALAAALLATTAQAACETGDTCTVTAQSFGCNKDGLKAMLLIGDMHPNKAQADKLAANLVSQGTCRMLPPGTRVSIVAKEGNLVVFDPDNTDDRLITNLTNLHIK